MNKFLVVEVEIGKEILLLSNTMLFGSMQPETVALSSPQANLN